MKPSLTAIPRCKSAPNITNATTQQQQQHSPSSSGIPDASVKTSKSAESSLKSTLHKLNVYVNEYVARKKWTTSSSSTTTSSNLTVENLREFNRRNDDKKRPSSPYYQGLTDQSIAIEKQKLIESSPMKDTTSGTRLSSQVNKARTHGNECYSRSDLYSLLSKEKPLKEKIPEPSPSSSSSRTQVVKNSKIKQERQHRHSSRTDLYTLWSTEKKPLKEKIIEQQQPSSFLLPSSSKTQEGNSKEIKSNTSRTDCYLSSSKEKFLRERVSEQPPPLPLPLPLPLPQRLSLPSPPPTPLVQKPEQEAAESSQSSGKSVKPEQEAAESFQSSGKSVKPEQEAAESSQSSGKSVTEEREKTVVEQSEMKFVWADKHRPKALKDFLCNRQIALELQASAISECNKHFIFEGPPGVGKRTMIFALLRDLFGHDKVQAREECKVFSLKGEIVPSIEVNIKVSTEHVEINLSEAKGYEQHVIVELLRGKSKKFSNIPLSMKSDDCKAIIICEAEKLSSDSMQYLKWILDRHKGCNKVFFCCSDASKLEPIKPICKVVQLQSPSNEEIISVLEFIAKQEGVELPRKLAEKFTENAKRNLRQAIRSFESTWHNNSELKEDQEIMTGWEDDIAKIARNIIEEQSPKQLYDTRKKLQNLIEHNVSAEFIFKTLGEELKKNLDEKLHNELHNIQQKYMCQLNDKEAGKMHEDPLRKAVHQFMKIEEFIAKFMSWYKANVVKKGK